MQEAPNRQKRFVSRKCPCTASRLLNDYEYRRGRHCDTDVPSE